MDESGFDAWTLARREGFREGETKASVVDEDEAGIADRDLGEGSACDERCKAGEDMEASLREGVV